MTRTHGGALSVFFHARVWKTIRAPKRLFGDDANARRIAVEPNDAPFRILSSDDREWIGADTQTVRSRVHETFVNGTLDIARVSTRASVRGLGRCHGRRAEREKKML